MPDRQAPRIEAVDPAKLDERTRDVLETSFVPGAPAANVFRTLANHGRLYRRWSVFSRGLFTGELSGRDRELIILRTALHSRSLYEWAQHNLVGQDVGLTMDEIARVAKPDLDGWPANEAVLLRAADELEQNVELSDDTWAELSRHYSTNQIVEIVMLPGFYRMVAGFLNTARVPLEDEFTSAAIVPFTPF